MVVDQNLIIFGELRHLKDAPGRTTDPRASDENKGVALAVELIVDIDIVYSNLSLFDWRNLLRLPSLLEGANRDNH